MLIWILLITYLTAQSRSSAVMRKSLYTAENKEVRAQLRAIREAAGLSQTELAATFGRFQSFVSTVERGLVRLDVVQVRRWCAACGTTFPAFAQAVEERLTAMQVARAAVRQAPRKRSKSTRR
jgi:transcriptional regulator with XRE-family HTH domain